MDMKKIFYCVFIATAILIINKFAQAAYPPITPPDIKLPGESRLVELASSLRPGAHIADAFTYFGTHSEREEFRPGFEMWTWFHSPYACRIDVFVEKSEVIGTSLIASTAYNVDLIATNKLHNSIRVYLNNLLKTPARSIPGTGKSGWVFNDMEYPYVFYTEGFGNFVRLVYCWQKDIGKLAFTSGR
jgi:hypothetical protein